MATHTRIETFHDLGWLVGLAVFLVLPCVSVRAQPAPSDTAEPVSVTLPPVDIIAPSPLLGSGVDRDTVPAETNVLKGNDLTRGGTLITPDVTRALNEQVGGVNLDSASGNPYQPTLFYHGFQASALQGTPQGLAVYVNGVRFNSAFGDTVNFDLLPDRGDRPDEPGRLEPGVRPERPWRRAERAAQERLHLSGRRDQLSRRFVRHVTAATSSTASRAAILRPISRRAGCTRTAGATCNPPTIENFYGDVGWRGNAGELHLNAMLGQLGAERAGHLAGGTAVPPTPPPSSPPPT